MRTILSRLQQIPQRLTLLGVMSAMALALLLPTTAMAAAPKKCDAKDVQCVITFGNQRIQERQDALTKLGDKVTAIQTQHLANDAQVDALHADVKKHQDSLNDLKKKLDAETDVKAARQDVKDVYTQLRIFAVVLPRDYRWLQLAIEIKLRDTLVDQQSHVEQLVDKAPADKQAQLKDLLNDYKASLTTAEGQIDTAQAIIPQLTASGFDTENATYKTNSDKFYSAVKSAHTNLHKAAEDEHKIAQILKDKTK